MVRYIFLLTLAIFLNASILQDAVKNIIGEQSYHENKALINMLFQDEQSFYLKDSNSLNYNMIINTLKSNSLQKQEIIAKGGIILTIKSINNDEQMLVNIVEEALVNMGVNEFFISYFDKNLNDITLKINLKSNNYSNTSFIQELYSFNTKIISNSHYQNNFNFKLDLSNVSINNQEILLNTPTKLKKPFKAYLIKLNDADILKIKANISDSWYPQIVLLDKNLKPLEEIREHIAKKTYIKISLPKDAKYAKIDDCFTLDNIKRGLEITLEK